MSLSPKQHVSPKHKQQIHPILKDPKKKTPPSPPWGDGLAIPWPCDVQMDPKVLHVAKLRCVFAMSSETRCRCEVDPPSIENTDCMCCIRYYHIHVYTCIYIYRCIYTDVYIYRCIYTDVYVNVYVCVCVCVLICLSTLTHLCRYLEGLGHRVCTYDMIRINMGWIWRKWIGQEGWSWAELGTHILCIAVWGFKFCWPVVLHLFFFLSVRQKKSRRPYSK